MFGGNPFVIGRDGTREEVIDKYSLWLFDQLEYENSPITLHKLADLNGKVLGCFCKPKECHGDVLVRASKWAYDYLEI